MAALNTVADYIRQARVLLADLIVPYRYADATLVDYLNEVLLEMVRLRPDLVFKLMRDASIPFYTPTSPADVVRIDYRYRPAVLFYIVGMAQLADQEETTDAHVMALMQGFTAKLMTLQA